MSTSSISPDATRELVERATLEVKKLRAQNKSLKEARSQPIAVVGMGCRFPGGASDPEALWRFLQGGGDAIREIPPGRWPEDAASPDARGARWAGLLDGDIGSFDTAFFQIAPREAMSLDPQQRLLLEVAWEALEHGGQAPDRLAGSKTGVFVGMSNLDYQDQVKSQPLDQLDAYAATGNLASTAAGRLSYALDLQGPCLSIDTACSSSLVAVHLGCQSLRDGESDLVLAGGVNLLLSPITMRLVAETQGLAPDGRCKTFDARADGFVRAEGCGVVVLKRLSDAQRDGDRIWALIRGSAVNQDGHSTGLTAPNVLSQQALLRQALERARVSPAEVSYIEAHGTGTSLGDPIEVEALTAALGEPRPDGSICALGSVKANLGHLEAAAGVAGLIKVVLAMHHEAIPRHLHFQTLNPRIRLEGTPFVIPTEELAWKRQSAPRIAGVSSFGISVTNAHVILQEAPGERGAAPAATEERWPVLLPLSARGPEALRALARSYRHELASAEGPLSAASLRDIAATASLRRSHHDHRLAVVGRTRAEVAEELASFGGDAASAEPTPGARPRVVFVFPGQGSQWRGMGRQLLEAEPVFRATIEACERAMRPHVTWSLTAELAADETSSRLGEIDVVQPVLWAIELSLAALWRSWGIEPDAVLGHSMGEVAAAHVAGVLSLDDAALILCRRSQLMRRVSGRGAMALVELTLPEAEQALRGYEARLSIAASNGPRSTVLSGDAAALDEVLATLQERGTFCRRVKVDVASHSPEVEGLLGELVEALAGIRPERARVPMLSTVTGQRVEGPELGPEYWARNLREPVRFAAGVQALGAGERTTFVEVSPHPILLPSIEDGLAAAGAVGGGRVLLPSLRRDEDERRVLLGSLGALYTLGHPIAWEQVHPGPPLPVPLPRYPWQHERYWIDAPASGATRRASTFGALGATGHPLLGDRRDLSADPAVHVWEAEISAARAPYLGDHRVASMIVLPAAAFVEMALAAAREVALPGPHALEDLVFEQVLVLPEAGAQVVQLVLRVDHPGRATFEIFGKTAVAGQGEGERRDADAPWTRHARGTLRQDSGAAAGSPLDQASVRARCSRVVSRQEHYEQMAAIGLPYGPRFQGIVDIHRGSGEALARVRLPEDLRADPYVIHPALLDACFQALASIVATGLRGPAGMLPVGVQRLRVHKRIGSDLACHAVVRGPGVVAGAERASADLSIVDAEGREVAEVLGLSVQRVELALPDPSSAWFYEVEWKPAPPAVTDGAPAPSPPRAILILADRGGVGDALRDRLASRGHTCVLARQGTRYRQISDREFELSPEDPAGFAALLRDAAALLGRPAPEGIVHLFALDAEPIEVATIASLRAAGELGCGSVLRLVQAIAQEGFRDAPRLSLITRGAQPVSGEGSDCAADQALLWGFGRTIMHEQPELCCALIDLDPQGTDADHDALAREIEAGGEEDQVAFRGAIRFGARLARAGRRAEQPRLGRAGARPFRLEIDRPGILDRLALRAIARRPPGPGEVEIEVAAAGLNFLDVLLALGALPDGGTDASGAPLGRECVGRVVAVGEGVDAPRVGDEVIALAPRCFGTHVIAPHRLVVPRPPSMSPEEAATIPLAFVTAHHALHHVARLRRGERVLIHAAAGGVGLAAVQIAARAGAEIFATAGSEEKRAYLRSLGVHHVMSSRDLTFVDEVRERTGGQGVDVVLNSLAGDFIPASLDLLRNYGRFIEIGKRDYEAGRRIGLKPFLRQLTFSLVDLRGMTLDRPEEVRALLEEVMALFAEGALEPLPRRVFPIADALGAFGFMARAEHMGKVVLSLGSLARAPEAPIAAARGERPRVAPDRTYLITGGLGGIGIRLAQWFVAEGARHLVLVGRSAPSERAEGAVAALRAAGAHVRVGRVDVAVRADVAEALEDIARSMPPLGGVVHAAGLLDDGALTRMTYERMERVLSPKVLGAWNLHELTRGSPLDLFVLCSSAAALLGSPGQASYTAANAFLDALAHHRRALGLPALCINWGAWTEVGLAAAQANRGDRLASFGLEGLSPDEGAEAFARLFQEGPTQRAAMRFDVRRWQELYLTAARSRLLSELGADPAGADASLRGGGTFRAQLFAAPPGERGAALRDHLREQVARVLRCDPSRIGASTPLQQGGLDSLMAMELRNRLEVSLGVTLNVTLIWRHPTVADLADHLASAMGLPLDAPGEGAASAPLPLPPAGSAGARPASETPAEAPISAEGADKIANVLRALKKLSASPRRA